MRCRAKIGQNIQLTTNFIKMKKTTISDFKHGIAKPMLAVVVIGKKSFKNADEFQDYCDDAMHDFLDNIQELNGYTYPADGDSLFEYEEGITFYYTKKGSELVHRWIKRMEAILDKFKPETLDKSLINEPQLVKLPKIKKHDAKTFFIDELVHAYFVNKKLKEQSEEEFINYWENIFL